MPRLSTAQRNAIFGRPGQVDRVVVATPWGIRVQCHRLIRDVFHDACTEAARAAWQPRRIDSYAYRSIRGSTAPSLHGYALAFDFFATPPSVPPPGGVWTPDNPVTPEFAECFTRRGFTWGARFSRVDVPHIEWAVGLPEHTATPARPAPPSQGDGDLTQDEHDRLSRLEAKLDAVRGGKEGGDGFTSLKFLDDRLKQSEDRIVKRVVDALKPKP